MKPQAILVSEYHYLSARLCEELSGVGVDVQVLSKSKDWNAVRGVRAIPSLSGIPAPSYFVVIHKGKPEHFSKEVCSYIAQINAKVVVAFVDKVAPQALAYYPFSELSQKAKTFTFVDMFGEDLEESDSQLQKNIIKAIQTKKLSISRDHSTVSALYVTDIISEIVKELFTYWTPKFVRYANVYTWSDLAQALRTHIPDLETYPDFEDPALAYRAEPTTHMGDKHFSETVKALVYKYKPILPITPKPLQLPDTQTPIMPSKSVRVSRKTNSRKYLYIALTSIIAFLLSPLIAVLVSGVGIKWSLSEFKSGNTGSMAITSVSRHSAEYAKNVSRYLPGYANIYKVAEVEIDALNVLQDGGELLGFSKKILSGVIAKSDYDVNAASRDAGLILSRLYDTTSDLSAKTHRLPDFVRSQLEDYLSDLEQSRKYILSAREVVGELPEILGANSTKKYMILLQNNMELRPTGGFIGSFALVTFDKGKLIDTEVMDVYAADGQLQGYVEPPAPIKNYLGEASWYLRDSNWSPDFPTSAARAEWFLDKSINREVDGVVAVNLETAKSILRAVGEVNIRDYNDSVSADNLYERVQYEVENDFFPGSKKKANYLAALTESLLESIKSLNPKQYKILSQEFADRLAARDIQIFMHNGSVQKTIRSLRWDGGVAEQKCSGNCENMLLGFVEANVGVNKANYHVERNSDIVLSYSKGKIIGEMSMTIRNTASRDASVPDNRYKNYLRVFAPKGVVFQSVGGESPEVEELETRVEGGLLVDVNPGEEKTVRFKWSQETELDFTKPGTMQLSVWKQSGVAQNSTQISLKFPEAGFVRSTPSLSLTKDGAVGYNTELIGDFTASVSWEGKK